MSLDFAQQNSGGFNASSGSATLPNGLETGSMVVICATIYGGPGQPDDWNIPTPAGFASVGGPQFATLLTTKVYIFAKPNAGGESSWTLESRLAGVLQPQLVTWAAFELPGCGLDAHSTDPLAGWFVSVPNTNGSNTAVATRSTGNTGGSNTFDGLIIAVHGAASTDTTPPEIFGHTNSFNEIVQVPQVGASQAISMSVSTKLALDTGVFETTASLSPSSACYAAAVVLFADGGKFAPMVDVMCGFEFGTPTGITNGTAAPSLAAEKYSPFDAVVGSPEVVSTHPRTGNFGLRLSSVAAAESLSWTKPGALSATQPTTGYVGVLRYHMFFEGSLPLVDVELSSMEVNSLANGMTVTYRTASQKIGVKVGSGTEVLSNASVAADKHIGIDARYDPRTTTHKVNWEIDYDSLDATAPVMQTQATNTGMTVGDITNVRMGWTQTTLTATVYYDDIMFSKQWASYPIGDIRIRGLKVDPAGTPTVNGTSSNFRIFTSNGGTLSTWTAAGTVTALDDLPPAIGGTSDGLAQISVAASDYVEIPMETWTAAPDFALRAARWYTAGWAASGNPATCALVYRDTASFVSDPIAIIADHGWDDTDLRWVAKMHRDVASTYYQLTQTRLDALNVRWGFSNDANPDVGIHCVLVEVAYSPVVTLGVIEQEGGAFTVYEKRDPLSGAIQGVVVTTPVGRGATFRYELSGVMQDAVSVPANTMHPITISADNVHRVTYMELTAGA